MSVGMADLYEALVSTWNASSLNSSFKALWGDPTEDEFFVLNEQEASGEQPMPYVILDQTNSSTINRMSGDGCSKREIRDIEVRFNIYARKISGDSRSPKQIAATLAEEILKIYGGHPTTSASGEISLTNGKHLITTYQTDFCVQVEEEVCQWVIVYIIKVDIPVAV